MFLRARAIATGDNERTMTMEPVLCSIADTARILGIGKTKTYELISDDVLECVTIGARRLVKVSSINKLVDDRSAEEAA